MTKTPPGKNQKPNHEATKKTKRTAPSVPIVSPWSILPCRHQDNGLNAAKANR